MSDNLDTNAIVYRALVASIAKELTWEEIYEVAFIWLKGNGDISKYSPSEKGYGLELFGRLECLGLFSFKNTDGLLEIVKSINRIDLVKRIETYKKKQKKGDNSYHGTKCTKKSDSSEKRQRLEQTFEVMVTQMAFLEQQLSLLQSTLQENLLDEGMEIVQHSGAVMQQLATNLTTLQEKFSSHRNSKRSGGEMKSTATSDQNSSAQVPSNSTSTQHVSRLSSPSSDSSLSSSDGSESEHSTSPEPATSKHSPESNRDKPLPIPRKTQQPKPDQQAVEESIYDLPSLPGDPLHTKNEDTQQAHEYDQPRNCDPVPSTLTQHVSLPKRNKPTPKPRSLKSIPTQMPIQESQGTVSELVHPSVENRTSCTLSKSSHHKSHGRAEEEGDQTGDSGMGTGSGATKYGTIEEWKEAIQNPPPDSHEHSYQSLMVETTDMVQPYQVVRK